MDLSVFGGVGYWLITRGFWLEYFDLILLLRCYCHNPKQFGSWNTPPTGQSGEYSTSKIDWLVCLGNPNRNSNDTLAQKYMKTHMFCKRLSYYRRNSNRNSNDTHAQKYMKTHMFCKHLSYYRRNSNRNSNDTHAQKYMKTYMFCMHLSYYRGNSNRNSNDTHAQKYMKTHICFSLHQVLPRELKPQLKSNSNTFDCKTYTFCSIWVERDLGLYSI